MKKLLFMLGLMSIVSCSKVPAGYVGVKVYLLGNSKGVDSEVLGVGRYFIGINEELYNFPTFQQNYVWTQDEREGSPNDESFTFQTKEGMSVGADIGISYHIDASRVSKVFEKYRKGVDEITDIFLRNHVRDALNNVSSAMSVEMVYGEGKKKMLDTVEQIVRDEVKDIGIVIDKVYLIGAFRLPDAVVKSLNSKIQATQMAQQRENEVQQTIAEANKRREEAKGLADAVLTQAEAQAKANLILSKSLTKELIEYKKLEKWNGELPKFTGAGNTMMVLGDK